MENKDKIRQSAIDYVARQIDVWNRTAISKKTLTTTWRKRTFVLILLGTFFGLLSQEIPFLDKTSLEPENSILLMYKVFAGCSAIAMALASYAGTQILTSDLEKTQIKARGTCEALKVQAFLYIMYAPPYSDSRAEEVLYERVELILKEVRDIIPNIVTVNEDTSKSPAFLAKMLKVISFGIYQPTRKKPWIQEFDIKMTLDQYFEERVDDQINGYYLKKASEFQNTVNKGNSISVVLGFIGVVLGTVAVTASDGLSMWIAFLGTASASIGSYLHSNKFEFLMISYVSTANKLELLSAKHRNVPADDLVAQRRIVAETETIFAMEHNAWISEIAGSVESEENEENMVSFQALDSVPETEN